MKRGPKPISEPGLLSPQGAVDYIRQHYGIRVVRQTIQNWAKDGLLGKNGRVYLRREKRVNRYFTRPEWVREFIERTSSDEGV